MDFLLGLLIEHGYTIVFVWTLFEGETIVALAGFAAYLGYLKIAYVIPIAIFGATIGDLVFFWIGRLKGRELLAKRPGFAVRIERVHRMTERYHGLIIFGSRFMYGFRTVIPIAFGANGVAPMRYFLWNLLGAIVWAPTFAFAGYAFGGAIDAFLGKAKDFEVVVALLVLGVAAALQLWSWRKQKRENALLVDPLNVMRRKLADKPDAH